MLDTKPQVDELHRKPFPCPLCKKALPLKLTIKQKPYCICQDCGIQVFFRRQEGIVHLRKILKGVSPIAENNSGSSAIVALYNRLETLRKEKAALEQKQGLVFRDKTLDHAIAAIDEEIHRLEIEIKNRRSRV